MADQSTDVIQGTLDLLILKTLSLEPMHGFGIARRIEQISHGVFRVNPGSLLIAFRRLERDGLVEAGWEATENNRQARVYRLTSANSAPQRQTDIAITQANAFQYTMPANSVTTLVLLP